MKKLLFYSTSVIIIILLDIIFSIPRIGDVFGLFFIIFTGLYKGSYSGCTAGFFIGLTEGVFSSTTFGVLSFSYSIIGYLSGRVPKRIDEENPLVQISIIFIGIIVCKVINIILEMLFAGTPGKFFSIWQIISVIFVPLFFLIFKKWWLLWFGRLDVDR